MVVGVSEFVVSMGEMAGPSPPAGSMAGADIILPVCLGGAEDYDSDAKSKV